MSLFRSLRRPLLALLATALGALPLAAAAQSAGPLKSADDRVALYRTEAAFDDVLFDLEQAVIGAGLVIDNRSHVGDMLARTAADVGAAETLYDHAEILLFCSADLSRKMMTQDLSLIGHCPYAVFAFDHPGEEGVSYVGYRRVSQADTPKDSPLREIDALLDRIAKEAAGL